MKALVALIVLVFSFIAISAYGDQYLTEAQKERLLEKSRALGQTSRNEHAQNASKISGQRNSVKQQNKLVKPRQTYSRYIGVVSSKPNSRTSTVTNNSRTQGQSFQSLFKNTDWGTPPAYSNRSVQENRQVATATNNNRYVTKSQKVATVTNGSRYIQQDKRLANTAKSRRPNWLSRQVSRSKQKKFNWSGFFKNLSEIAGAINHGLSQTNTGFNPYIPQPTNFTPQRTTELIQTMNFGNHTINVGGNHQIRTWDVGNQTFGTFDNKEVKMYNYGNFSHGTIGGQKIRCHMAGGIQFCK